MKSVAPFFMWPPAALIVLLLLTAPIATAQGWTQLTNTALKASTTNNVCPPNKFQLPGGGLPTYNFLDSCSGVINAWSGAAADTKRNRLLIIGGGHAAYNGNEVYSLDLTSLSATAATGCTTNSLSSCSTNAAAPAMTRLTNPSPYSNPDACPQIWTVNPDGSPLSQHTYGSIQYLPKADAVTMWMGATNTCGHMNRNLFLFHLDTLTWENMNPTYDQSNIAGLGGPASGDTIYGNGVYWTLDPSTEHESLVGWVGNKYMVRYDKVLNRMFLLVPYATYSIQQAPTVVADPDRKLMFAVGNDGVAGQGKMFVTDLRSPTYATTEWTSTLTGCADWLDFANPGAQWDSSIHKIVGYVTKASGTSTSANKIIIFDPATRTCTTHPMSGGGPVAEDDFLSLNRGMHGRFSYFPALGKYAVVNNFAGDAYTFSLNATPTHGLGASTLTCVDRDGDGYGTGPGCAGPDADDQDAGVHTGDQALAKWGTMPAFLAHLGYRATNIWYISNSGTDHSTSGIPDCKNNAAAPCATYNFIYSGLAGGDVVMIRGGVQTQYFDATGKGRLGAPLVLMSYPGELATFSTYGTGITCSNGNYFILDGFRLANNAGTAELGCGVNNTVALRHIDTSGNLWGIVAANIQEFTIEDCTNHNSTEHGIYLTNHGDYPAHTGIVDKNIFIRRNLMYSNGPSGNGLHINGRFGNVVIEQNVAYNNEVAGLGIQTGMSYSTMRSNLLFGNGSGGIVINDYPDFCGAYDTTGPCPYDQNHNLIEGNTIYETGTKPISGDPAGGQVGLSITNGGATSVDMGYTTIRNNIFVTNSYEGAGGGYPHIRYDEAAYAATSTFENNLFFSTQGAPGTYTNVIRTVSGGKETLRTCAQAMAASGTAFARFTGCQNSDPKFVAASPSFWNSPASFNLRLQASSPARRHGSPIWYTLLLLRRAGSSFPGCYLIGSVSGCGHCPGLRRTLRHQQRRSRECFGRTGRDQPGFGYKRLWNRRPAAYRPM